MSNLPHILQTAMLMLAAYLVGCVLGYAARWILHAGRGRRVVPQPSVGIAAETPATIPPIRPRSNAARLAAAAAEPESAEPTAVHDTRRPPPRLAEPRQGKPDRLQQIKGIGPKIEASLHGLGVFHIDQIAAWTPGQIDWIDNHLAFKGRVRRERWVEQARQLLVGA